MNLHLFLLLISILFAVPPAASGEPLMLAEGNKAHTSIVLSERATDRPALASRVIWWGWGYWDGQARHDHTQWMRRNGPKHHLDRLTVANPGMQEHDDRYYRTAIEKSQ